MNGVKAPIAVIAIAGKYRGGKSYILNNLVKQPGCFGVSNSTKACTQGLWIYDRAIPITRNGVTINVIFMDTEGLGDVDKDGDNNDVRIFMLTLLMSSHCIFNCKGVIDS